MANHLSVIAGNRELMTPPSEDKFRHYRNVMGVVLQDAQKTWGDLWEELQGEVAEGALILPEAENGFKPRCGWPEFLEKMWLLKHRLDYARRYTEERL